MTRQRAGGSRAPGLRTAKTTLAAVLSYVVADWIGTSPAPVLAPLTALLVVQLTLYQTLAHGWERIASVTSGVLVALGVASLVGLTWWSLGAVVAVSLVIGRLLRLGPHLPEVAISAMLVLAVGGTGAEVAALDRVLETLIGAAVGVGVNAVIAPPLYERPAGAALTELSDRMATFLRELAEAVSVGWSRAEADRWLTGARALAEDVRRADRSLARAEESARLNPRGVRGREARPRMRTGLTALEHTHVSVRSMCRAMLDRTYFVPEDEQAAAYADLARGGLVDVLRTAAAAVAAVPAVITAAGPAPEASARLQGHLTELQVRRDRLAALLLVDPRVDEGAWQQHGALLAAIDRIRVEVAATVGPPPGASPPALSGRQARLAQRVLESRRRRAEGRQRGGAA